MLITYKGLVLSGPGCTNTIYPMLSFSNYIVCFMLCSGHIGEQPITSCEHWKVRNLKFYLQNALKESEVKVLFVQINSHFDILFYTTLQHCFSFFLSFFFFFTVMQQRVSRISLLAEVGLVFDYFIYCPAVKWFSALRVWPPSKGSPDKPWKVRVMINWKKKDRK